MLVVGKAGELPFEVIDDAAEVRAPIAGVVAGLRAAAHDVVVFLPVDCPRITADVLRRLGEACARMPRSRRLARSRVRGRRARFRCSSAAWRKARSRCTGPTTG